MPEPNAAEVLNADVAEKDNAEELTAAAAQTAGAEDTEALAKPDDETKRKGGWLRKLSKAEQERDFWREEALRNRGDKPAQSKPAEAVEEKPPVKPVRPKASDFSGDDAWDKFQAARDKFEDDLVEYTDRVTDFKLKQAEKTKQVTAEQQTIANNFATQVAEAKERYEDFEEVAFNEDIPMTAAVHHAIVRSKYGAEIAYYLGQHPDEAERISKLEPVDAIMEIGEIAKEVKSRIASQQSAADKEDKEDKPAPQAATSRAPRPVAPVRRQASAAVSTEPDDKDDWKTWERKRLAQLAQR